MFWAKVDHCMEIKWPSQIPSLVSPVEVPSTWHLYGWWLKAAELLQTPSQRALVHPLPAAPISSRPSHQLFALLANPVFKTLRQSAMRKVTANTFCFLCYLHVHGFSGIPQLHKCGTLLYAPADSLSLFSLDSLSGRWGQTFLGRMCYLGRSSYWEVTSVSVWLLPSWKPNRLRL